MHNQSRKAHLKSKHSNSPSATASNHHHHVNAFSANLEVETGGAKVSEGHTTVCSVNQGDVPSGQRMDTQPSVT